MFSTSTIASSTSSPIATASPPRVIVLIDMPNHLNTSAGHHDRQRDGRQGDERRAEVQQEDEEDDGHEDAAVAQGVHHVVDGQVDELLLLIQIRYDANVARQRTLQFVQSAS